MTAVVKWPGRKVTLDVSATVVNGLFLQFEREFDDTIDFIEMLRHLSRDEEELFKIPGIEVGRG
jgi:predicted phosphoadenosine phosphosulfate sulfurtransferase